MTDLTFGQAICAVLADVERLDKADKNAFDGYMFTSVNDMKDGIRPLLAKHGLFPHVTEVEAEPLIVKNSKGQERHFVRYRFDITLFFHTLQALAPERMSVILPLTGAQTSGAARSYAVKEWIKSRFLQSSGDMQEEADLMEQSRGELRIGKANARAEWAKLETAYHHVLKGQDSQALIQWAKDNREALNIMPRDWVAGFRVTMKQDLERLKAEEQLDAMSPAELDELAKGKS